MSKLAESDEFHSKFAIDKEKNFYEGRDLEVLAGTPRYLNWIIEDLKPYLKGDVLEIGAGLGTVSERLVIHSSSLDLVEPSPQLIGRLQSKFADNPLVKVYHEMLETFLDDVESNKYDVVVMVNVLEHIEDDVDALNRLRNSLKPGGHLFLFVPAIPFLFSRLDEIHGHYRRYLKNDLKRKISDAGYQLKTAKYFDILGILPWYIINTLIGATTFNPTMIKLYDRVDIPVTRAFERYIDPPLGKNLLLVAEKNRM